MSLPVDRRKFPKADLSSLLMGLLVSSRFPVKTFRFMTVIFMSFLTKILSTSLSSTSLWELYFSHSKMCHSHHLENLFLTSPLKPLCKFSQNLWWRNRVTSRYKNSLIGNPEWPPQPLSWKFLCSSKGEHNYSHRFVRLTVRTYARYIPRLAFVGVKVV